MQLIRAVILFLVFSGPVQHITAQTINWNSLNNSKHVLTMGMGWDHSLSYNLGYSYKISSTKPLLLHTNLSIPSGEKLLDDFKWKLGGQAMVLSTGNLRGSVSVNGILRRYESPLVRLMNVGAEVKGTVGYYKPSWFLAGEVGFDKALVTHFEHSEIYKETIYSSARDGWSEPSTGGNFSYGFQTGYSFNACDITLNVGRVITQDFKTAPLIPFYFNVGFNVHLFK